MEFNGKVVVITGAANGIGKETAKAFANEGAKLVLVDLDKHALGMVASELELQDYLTIEADVSKEEQVIHYVNSTKEKYERIDVFFNNAGIGGELCPITEMTAENFNNVINVNLNGIFYGLKHVLVLMQQQKSGSVINTASGAGLRGQPGLAAYSASKHAVLGLTKTAAKEVASYGVRVNAICPSAVDTQMIKQLEDYHSPNNRQLGKKSLEENNPTKRYARTDEIAQLVLFLASKRASYINGSEYRIDGGLLS